MTMKASAEVSATRHTPGPWKVLDRCDHPMIRTVISDKVSADDFPFEINMPSPPFALGSCGALVAIRAGISTSDGSAEANARLIAAAPEMLEALKAITKLDPADTAEGFNEWGEAQSFRDAQQIAADAIKKAEGRSQ